VVLGGILEGTSAVPAAPPHESLGEEAPMDIRVVPGSRSLEQRAPDPRGGLEWGLLVGRSETGRVCLFAGRLKDGQVGRVNLDGSFTPRPEAPTDSCGELSGETRDPALVIVTAADGDLVFHGAAGPKVTTVTLAGEELTLSPHKRGYLAVRRGTTDDLARYPVTVHLRDGSTVVYPWDGPPVAKRG
jgi:hypothetical protein